MGHDEMTGMGCIFLVIMAFGEQDTNKDVSHKIIMTNAAKISYLESTKAGVKNTCCEFHVYCEKTNVDNDKSGRYSFYSKSISD